MPKSPNLSNIFTKIGVSKFGIKRRIWLLLFYPAAFLLCFLTAKHPTLAELYAKSVYFDLSLAVNRLTRLAPFSVAELLLGVLLVGAVVYIVLFILFLCKGKKTRSVLVVKFITNILCFFGVIYFLFALGCGINYNRYTFAQTSGLIILPSTKTELTDLCTSLAGDVNRLRGKEETDKSSVTKLRDKNFSATAEEARKSFDRLSSDYPLLKSGYGAPKPVLLSGLMSRCNITGIFVPFTFEANVNTGAPAYTLPATMCHELSHLRGYMREDEANFIGYLACLKSGDPDFQYSGSMLAFTYASNALYATDPQAASGIYAKLSDGVRKDLTYNSNYWKQFEGPVAAVSNSVNDHYLRANSQKDGVQSYGRMVDLLLARQKELMRTQKK